MSDRKSKRPTMKSGRSKRKSIIRIEGVWKTYKMGTQEVHALRGLDFEVKSGEFVAVMGPSGSGKSTCVNMIGCLDVPSQGNIYLEGQNIAEMSESELAQVRGRIIGFIFQQFNLIQTLTALENVALPAVFQDTSRTERMEKAGQLLTLVGLGDRMNHRPNELSGGQQQRVAIARSLMNDPDVILADEPTGNLDTKTGEQVMALLGRLHTEEKKTIVMVTHDEEVANHADRVEFLRDGEVVESRKKHAKYLASALDGAPKRLMKNVRK